MPKKNVVSARAEAIVSRIDCEQYGFDPSLLIPIVTNLLLPALADCLHVNDDVSSESAQGRIRAMNAKNPKRLLKRTRLSVQRQYRDKRNEHIDDAKAAAIAQAIIDDAVYAEPETAATVFGACLTV